MKQLLMALGILAGIILVFSGLISLGTHSGASKADISRALPADEIISDPWISIDRAAVIPASADTVWPWVAQLGKDRAGWYAPMWLENLLKLHSAARIIPEYQQLAVGNVVPDWGGGVLKVISIDPGHAIAYGSLRPSEASSTNPRYAFTWTLVVDPIDASHSKFQLRLRLRRPDSGSARYIPPALPGLIDWATDVVMFAGLSEKVRN
jgi:hypothetical protein